VADPHDVASVIAGVVHERLTYLKGPALRDIAAAVAELEQHGRDGAIVECGTALGGSAIVIAAAKRRDREMKIYDLFGMIPAPTDADGDDVMNRYATIVKGESQGIGGDVYYGYRDDLIGEVTASFERYGLGLGDNDIELVQGDFADTLQVDFPVALAHLDGDWYESTKVCLERIVPQLVAGGRLIIDDYKAWHGCRKAVDEYFADRPGYSFVHRRRLHIVKDE
jgi:asparagine synthase (glutamine-hydrolysing)